MIQDKESINSMGLKVADHVTAMLAYWDKDLVCRFANAAYREWFGKTREEMVDKITLPELLGALYEKNLPYILGALAGNTQTFEREIPTPTGGLRHSLANYFPDIENGEVKGFFVHVADITRIKLLEKELTSSNEQIKEQNGRLLSFANIVSHNLRSHAGNLKAILGFLNEAKDDTERQPLFNFLENISKGFSETVNHLNDIVAIQNQQQLKLEEINLYNFVEQALNILAVQISTSNADVVNHVDKQTAILANSAYTESIVLNLLTNALKYRHPERRPRISLACTTDKDYVTFTVTDNGRGINLEKYRKDLFGMYKTFHKNPDAKGIGLFITKMQVEAMGGYIDVESQENHGTSFIIRFPIVPHGRSIQYNAA
ncbi:PAS domain-containing sensor histidine kinase [Chryseolinea sp. H1M3-3]|uniref:PAS domain-containing sensor histidine kinase n=1 Tax=Chryseolinea sp. H1M3-3 TaxID=3034144 RepID=UPI0023EBD914|nr:PAS domain-containing sensor histidine kinase [Chryseolinea sp. H1M3-3]